MTRYTNVGRKRTFLQAGFSDGGGAESSSAAVSSENPPDSSNPTSAEPVEKRSKKSPSGPLEDGEAGTIRNAYEGRGKSKGEAFENADFKAHNAKQVNASGYLKRKRMCFFYRLHQNVIKLTCVL